MTTPPPAEPAERPAESPTDRQNGSRSDAESSLTPQRRATTPKRPAASPQASFQRANSSSSRALGPTATASPHTPAPPLPPSSSSSASAAVGPQTQQVGSRQGTRSRSRTLRKGSVSSSGNGAPQLPRFNSDDHPLSAHKLAARGYHSFSCLGVPFHVPKRYSFLRELGIGAYGCVALARDEELDTNVAIKKVTRVFERDVLARRALREVAILRHMLKNQNCSALIDFDTTFIDFSEIYLVLSASEADLSQIIRSGQSLSDAHLQYFAAQLLRGVRHMHAANIVHRDLKPGNILVNADCALFICDFGLARAFAAQDEDATDGQLKDDSPKVDGEEKPPNTTQQASQAPTKPAHIQTSRLQFPGGPLTEYVSTRWYRAPEIMLGFREGYGTEIDMWSVGCILAELASGKPLFDGKDYVDQIARIHDVLGPPSERVINRISSERARVYVESLPQQDPVPLTEVLKGSASPGLLDLLEKLLVWEPSERLTAAEALKHPWLSAYHGITEQWEKPAPFSKFAEVELINTLSEFKGALQSEADGSKGEYEALFGGQDDQSLAVVDQAVEDGDADDEAGGDVSPPAVDDAKQDGKPGSAVADASAMRSSPSVDGVSKQAVPQSSQGSSKLSKMVMKHDRATAAEATSSPEVSSTDTGTVSSPVTSVGGSLSGSHSSSDNIAGLMRGLPSKSGIVMTPADSNSTTTGKTSTEPQIPASAAPSTVKARQTLPNLDAEGKEPQARYRRRAISNAPRPQAGEGSVSNLLGLPGPSQSPPLHRTASSRDRAETTIVSGAAAAAEADASTSHPSLDLDQVASFSPNRDDAVLTPQKPSPDFRRYTTDLIARPRSELGAFASPALEAGDDAARSLRRRSSAASEGQKARREMSSLRAEALDRSGSGDRSGASTSTASRVSSSSTLAGGLDATAPGAEVQDSNAASKGEARDGEASTTEAANSSVPSDQDKNNTLSILSGAANLVASVVPGVGGGGQHDGGGHDDQRST